ncbi:MAG TPA: glycosyltransferase family 4 protein [Anaerolineales bacterium]
MNILIFSSEFPPGPGGIGTHAYQMALQMSMSHWRVLVLAYQDYMSHSEIEEFNHAQPFEIIQLQRQKHQAADLRYRWEQLQQTVIKWKPDLLVVTGDRLVWLTAAAQAVRGLLDRTGIKLPWCAIWHGIHPSNPFQKLMMKWAYSKPDLTIAVSRYSKSHLLSLGVQSSRVAVIPNGANDKIFFPDLSSGQTLRTKMGFADAFVLLTVGHVSHRKGQDIVIRSLPEVLERNPRTYYLIAGLPTMQPELEKLVNALGIGNHVHFMGRAQQEELFAAYNACDVFVLVSRHSRDGEYEGYGIVVSEAALCGKPSVVAENSGLTETVSDGVTGFVVPENDPHTTAQTILALMENSELRKKMALEARQRAITEQTWEVSMDRYNKAFRQLLLDSGGRRS